MNRTEDPAALRQGSVMLQKYVDRNKILSMFLETFLLFLPTPLVWIACTVLKLFYLHKTVKALGPPEQGDLASTLICPVMLLGYCFKDAKNMSLFLQMRKWSTEQGRTTSEEPCSESKTQEHSFIGFKVCLITGILLNCLPFQAPLTTMLLSLSWSQDLLWQHSADQIWKEGNFDGQDENIFLSTFTSTIEINLFISVWKLYLKWTF